MAWGTIMAMAELWNSGYQSTVSGANANITQEWGEYNAEVAQENAAFNAAAIEELGWINNQFLQLSTEAQAVATEELGIFNASLRILAAEQNTQLLEKEAGLVWEKQGLDQFLLGQEVSKVIAASRNAYAGAGIEVNVGAPVDLLIDQKTQAALESHVIRYNAEIAMDKLLDAAAIGEWEAEMEATSIIYSAKSSADLMRTNAEIAGIQNSIQTAFDVFIINKTGDATSASVLHSASNQANQIVARGNQLMINGLFNAGTSLANEWGTYETSELDSDYDSLLTNDD